MALRSTGLSLQAEENIALTLEGKKYTYVYVYVYIYMYVCIHIYTHIYVYINVWLYNLVEMER